MICKLKENISNNFSKFVSTSLIDKKYNKIKGPEANNLWIIFPLAIKKLPYLV